MMAEYQEKQLVKNGESVTKTAVNSRDEFEKSWASMSGNINNVMILTHSTGRSIMFQHGTSTEAMSVNGKNLSGGTIGDINSLPKKNIDNLSLISCNSGNLDQAKLSEGNVAQAFAKPGTIDKVTAYDGNVGFGDEGFFGGIWTWITGNYYPRESNKDEGFYDVMDYVENKGVSVDRDKGTEGAISYFSDGAYDINGW